MQSDRLFVVLGVVSRNHVDRITPSVNAGSGIERVAVSGDPKASPKSAMWKRRVTKSKDIWWPAAHDPDLVIRFIPDKHAHVDDSVSVANTEDVRRHLRPDTQPDVGIGSDNAIATGTQAKEG